MILKYGSREILFKCPEQAEILTVQDPEFRVSPARFRDMLQHELGRLRSRLNDIAIVVADKTRLCGYPEYLPVLLEALAANGAEADHITIFIAYGTHARQTEAECLAAYGETYRHYRFVHHDCREEKMFERVGRTSQGTPVFIRQDILRATLLITFGAVCHHYFAGYGGGRKLVFPGLGLRQAIYRNHGLFLDSPKGRLALQCLPGVISGNPVAEDLDEIETFRPADLAIHGILNREGRVCDLLVGNGADFFRKACEEHGGNCEISTTKRYDTVLASCGGYPRDINFIQSHKAAHNAAQFVRDGGTLIMLAECRDGIGSQTFLSWFELGGWDQAFKKLSVNYEGNGGTALAMMAKVRRIRILLVTDLEEAICRQIGVEKISLAQAHELIASGSASLAFIPDAGLLVKRQSEREFL